MSAATRAPFFAPMSGLPDHRDWSETAQAVARWVMLHGGSMHLVQLAGWAAVADGRGDSALDLGHPYHPDILSLAEAELAALESEAMVAIAREDGTADRAPFVIDNGHFYLWRNFSHERAVARQLKGRITPDSEEERLDSSVMDVLFQDPADGRDWAQCQAVARVRGKRLFVLTGGPGTGKTTTALRMLLLLARDHLASSQEAPLIRLAAPTGKAAQRLGEAIASGLVALGAGQGDAFPPGWQGAVAALKAATSSTLHRLLGSRGAGGFAHHAGHPIAADIVVVDEASMASLAMLRLLLDALREETSLILLGDADQLTSVETGSVLLDLVRALESQGSSHMVRLTKSFRATAELSAINKAILQGSPEHFHEAWNVAAASDMTRHRSMASPAELIRALRSWAGLLLPWLKACQEVAGAPEAVLQCLQDLRQHQLLCALREGLWGALQANARIEQEVRKTLAIPAAERWYPGRAVMVTRNDGQGTGLFNGDVGLCLRDERGDFKVWFERTLQESSVQKEPSWFAPGNLPPHQGAFALTIHKSQGSEYDHVAVLLPPEQDNPILSRQLLYTGLSRAKKAVELWGSDEVIHQAITTPVARKGRLEARLLDELEKAS